VTNNCLDLGSDRAIPQRTPDECNEWYAQHRPDRRILESIRISWYPPGWMVSVDPCSKHGWPGVTCDPVFGTGVVGLDFSNLDVVGDLSQGHLEQLQHLQTLSLSHNPGMQGSIPPGLGNLVNLTRLALDNCALSGPIPESLLQSNLAALATRPKSNFAPADGNNVTVLSLDHNWLNGTLPAAFLSSPLVRYGENCLADPIPNQRLPGDCVNFYTSVSTTPVTPGFLPPTFPYYPKPPAGSTPSEPASEEGQMVAADVLVIITICVLSVGVTVLVLWWFRRKRRIDYWRKMPDGEVPSEKWQLEAMAKDVQQYSVSRLKQVSFRGVWSFSFRDL
jgi:hypothetical protein